MKLAPDQARQLLEHYGCYVTEVCDKCGQLLGWVRYTRQGEAGEWCSRECRGDFQKLTLKAGRPRKYRNGRERRAAKTVQQRNYRSRLGVEKTVCTVAETKDLQAQKTPLSQYPLTDASGGPTAA
jgi:hypothetical protein